MDIKENDYVQIRNDSNGWQGLICVCSKVKEENGKETAYLWHLNFPQDTYNVTDNNRDRVQIVDINKIGDEYKSRMSRN